MRRCRRRGVGGLGVAYRLTLIGTLPPVLPPRVLRPRPLVEVDTRIDDAAITGQLEGRHGVVRIEIDAGEMQRDDVPGRDVEDGRPGIPAERGTVVCPRQHRLAEAVDA